MKVHVLQHVPFEGLGSIQAWLDARGAAVSWTRFYASPSLPELAEVDFVIALGGPMSIHDEVAWPWLIDEKRFIREAIASGKRVLGICLGAQLIANALGARVYQNQHREIGWFPVDNVAQNTSQFQFPSSATVFHWHGETFDLPPGTVRLARSAACENQAFQLGENVIGLQFHLETTPASADAIISHCRNELAAGAYIQTEEALRAAPAVAYAEINHLMASVLDFLVRGVG